MNGEVKYTTGKMTAGLESPADIRERMVKLAMGLADDARAVFYVGWSDARMRWVVSNDRAEMVRDCATMEAVCPDWDRIAERKQPMKLADWGEVAYETRRAAMEAGAMGKNLAREMAETDRRATEFNDMDPDITVVRVLVYKGRKSWVKQTLARSVISKAYHCSFGMIEEIGPVEMGGK